MNSFGDESGATLVIVALSLIAMLGMTVLVVDVGGLLTLRRRMVTAADSAALAAAQSCALDRAADAPVVANQFAGENVTGTVRTKFDLTGCGSSGVGSVDLAYEKDQELYFAPILGAPDTSEVEGAANAIWGPAATAPVVPYPMTLNTGDAPAPCYSDRSGTPCGYWFSDARNAAAYTNRSTGRFANLLTWPSAASRRCNGSGASSSQLAGWMATNPRQSISPSASTYVCVDSPGHASTTLSGFASRVGDMLIFPINDSSGMIYRGNNANKFRIVGFAPLRLAAVYPGDDPAAVGTPDVDDICEDTYESLTPNDVINLLGMTESGCPLGAIPDRIGTPVVTDHTGKDFQPNVDYRYDPAALSITWLKDFTGVGNGNGNGQGKAIGKGKDKKQDDVTIEYDWHIDGTTGACGQQPSDANAVCIVTRWEGAQIGGGSPVTGIPDFGVRAVRLDS
jgi:hypothetical protein